MKVWVCFSGEYEQRSATAVFNNSKIAKQYSDDVEEFELGDSLPVCETAYEVSGIFPFDPHAEASYGYVRIGKWSIKREHWQSDSYQVLAMSGENVGWYGGERCKKRGIYVRVIGANIEELSDRFLALQAEVEAGRKPEY